MTISPFEIWRAEQREALKKAKLHAAIEREREVAGERKAEREMNADMAFYKERELHDRGVRNISRKDYMSVSSTSRAETKPAATPKLIGRSSPDATREPANPSISHAQFCAASRARTANICATWVFARFSLVVSGQLWGLIMCHNGRPLGVEY